MNRYRPRAAILLCVAALLSAGVLSACGSSSTDAATGAASGAASAPAGAPASTAATPTGPAQIGDQLTAGPWTFSVSDVSVQPEAPGQVPPPAGKELLFVNVNLGNTGTETLLITPQQFALRDASGATVKTFRAYPDRDVRAGRSWTERGGHETVPS